MHKELTLFVRSDNLRKFKVKQKSWFLGYAPKRDNKTNHVQLKFNITPLVYSECVLKVGDSGHFSS